MFLSFPSLDLSIIAFINLCVWVKTVSYLENWRKIFFLDFWELLVVLQTHKLSILSLQCFSSSLISLPTQTQSLKILLISDMVSYFHVFVTCQFSSVQSLSRVQLFVTPWTAARQASLSITNSQSLLKLMSIKLVMPSNHLNLYPPLLLLPSIFPSIMGFSNESVLGIRWPKYWSFSFNISPSNEHPGLISFRMDWLYLLAVQGTLKSLLQHHSSKTSILWCSAFFMVQLSHLCMTTGKTTALTRWTFVGKVMSLLFNMLSMLVIAPLEFHHLY